MSSPNALYYRLFSHPLMTEQLLREFAPEATAVGLNFARMEQVRYHSGYDGGAVQQHQLTGQPKLLAGTWTLPISA